jgi:Fe-S-cluster containining protein
MSCDIQRIISEQKVEFGDFVCGWGESEGRIGTGVVPRFYFQDAPGVPFVIGITPRPSQTFPGTRKCPFLREEPASPGNCRGEASCSIYESRPLACRIFPFHRSSSGEIEVSPELEVHAKRKEPPYSLCPSKWTLGDQQREAVEDDLAALEVEMRFLGQLAARWNRQPGLWAHFPAFLSEQLKQSRAA